jgi:hypothetical protein
MFLKDADMTCLRQGDILANVLYPLLLTEDVRFMGVMDANDLESQSPSFRVDTASYRKLPSLTCQLSCRIGYAAVVSNCCDIEPENNRIRRTHAIVLARVVPIPVGIERDPNNLESLKANRNPLNLGAGPGHINRFYMPAHELLGPGEWIVDYSQVLSIPSQEFPEILKRKILQMDDDARIRFKVKLAASFGRFSPEEQQSGHPWLVAPKPPIQVEPHAEPLQTEPQGS